ncbi:MAG TPA: ferritin-like domain-containing protein [Marmoricola sp.]|nr:ferritin-like domain-containing protein [Marmoricola sp.]
MTPVEALQTTLAGEHAAVHVFATLGGRVSASANPTTAARLREGYETHRARRDHLRSWLADLGEQPVPPAAGYDVDDDSRDPERLTASARRAEERCTAVYAQLVASSTGPTRRWAVQAATDSALRCLSLGGTPSAYPGLRELS